jgi:prepilin-type N-terminal cleavage/methylation domain-containing protein
MQFRSLQSGFTLVETIMVIGIYAIMMAVIFTNVYNLYQANSYTIGQSYEIDQARRGVQNFVRDVREMTFSDTGTFPIARIEPHRFGFYSNIDGTPSVEYIEYVLSSTTLYKNIHEASGTPAVYNLTTPSRVETLSEYVQNILQATSTFRYYDNAGALLTSTSSLLTDVRYIEVVVIVNIDPLKSPGEFLLRSGVAPRNIKDNL